LNADPIVDHYDLGGKAAYVLVVPDEKGRTADYQLDLPGVDSAKVYLPKIGADSMSMQYVKTVDGKLKITVTETPTFVIPIVGDTIIAQNLNALQTQSVTDIKPLIPPVSTNNSTTSDNTLKLFPNPSAGYVNVAFTSTDVNNTVSISVINSQTGQLYKTFTSQKNEKDYAKLIDLSSVSTGVYIIQVKQGNNVLVKKLIRVN